MPPHSLQSSQKLAQTTAITPRLQRALKLLQVPSAELRTELAAELAANPVLEEMEPESPAEPGPDRDAEADSAPEDSGGELTVSDDDFSALRRMEEDWRESYYDEQRSQSYTAEDAERRDRLFESRTGEASFQQRLLEQARDVAGTPGVLAALEALIGHLDERGFLTDDPRDIALGLRLDAADMDRALSLLHEFDPPGLGARDVRECLLIQLRVSGRASSPAARLLEEAYEDLLRRRFPEIAKRLRLDPDAVREAVAEIARLDPAPARRFAEDDNHAVAADVVVVRDEETGLWRAELTGEGVPRLRLSHPYKELLAGGRLSAKDRAYLAEKMKEGRFLIDALAHRQSTVLGVAARLIERQADFFDRGRPALKPLTMATVAADLGIHETSVSRAVAGKWMRTPQGLVEMRDFFTSGYTTAEGGSVAVAGVKEMIADIVAAEDAAGPLSDEAIAEALDSRGLKVARRTVAKYREELGIAPKYLRRRQP